MVNRLISESVNQKGKIKEALGYKEEDLLGKKQGNLSSYFG